MSIPRWQRAAVRVASTRPAGWLIRNVANPIDKRLIPATNGRLSTGPFLPTLVMESLGAKSGQPRRTPLVYVRDGENLGLIASATGIRKNPGWFYNLRKNPDVRVWGRRGITGEYVARVATGEERARIWRLATEIYPGYDTYDARASEREIPVIALTPKR